MKRSVALALLVALMLSLLCPALAAETKQSVEVSLVKSVSQIETRHIQDLEIRVKNLEYRPQNIRLVMNQTDYKGGVLSRAVTGLTLKENSTADAREHLKILPAAYKVQVFAENADGVRISNLLEMPIQSGFSVADIQSIPSLRVTIPQWSDYTLPATVEAVLYTGETVAVPVEWDGTVTTENTGIQTVTGRVKGYGGQKVQLTVNVTAADKIDTIAPLDITIGEGMNFTLPTTVKAQMHSGADAFYPVIWEDTPIPTATGTVTFTGTVAGYSEPVKLTLTVKDVKPDDVYTFQNYDVAALTADELDLSYEYGEDIPPITYGQIASIKKLDFVMGYEDPNMEDLRWFTGLETLSLSNYMGEYGVPDVTDLTPIADLTNLKKIELSYQSTLKNLAPLLNLRSLTHLSLSNTGVTDFSPVYPVYEQLTNWDKDSIIFTPMEMDSTGSHTLALNVGDTYTLPFCVLMGGEYIPVAWARQEISVTELGSFTVTGTSLDRKHTFTVTVTAMEKDDYPIQWKDAAIEAGVRKAIDKPTGTIYYSDVRYLKDLDCFAMGVKSLEDLEHLPSLTHLGVAANYLDDSQWKYMEHLTKMEYLDVAMNKFTRIPAGTFKNMPNLIELCADENNITVIEPGAFLGQEDLDTIMLEDNYHLTDISEVSKIPGLKTLAIGRTPISSLECIRNAKNLEYLWASECPITDISPLADKPNLYWVDLKHHISDKEVPGKITDISVFKDAKKLYWLILTGQGVEDISALADKPALKILDLKDNQVKDVSPLSGCLSLEIAYLNGNEISSVAPLADLPAIASLYLQDNNISDVSPLAGLKTLNNLYLAGNPVTNFSALADLYPQLNGKDFRP